MDLREQIIAKAREWLDTPFVHQGCKKGKGCDCLGLILGVGEELGIKFNGIPLKRYAPANYSRTPNGLLLKQRLDALLKKKEKKDIKPGDIFLMNFGSNPQHLGFFSNYENDSAALGLIHCYSQTGKVVEHRLTKFWHEKIEQVYSITD